jgi:hypothetical protein
MGHPMAMLGRQRSDGRPIAKAALALRALQSGKAAIGQLRSPGDLPRSVLEGSEVVSSITGQGCSDGVQNAVFASASLFLRPVQIYRAVDAEKNVLVYTVVSTKLINGSPFNSISVVPVEAR